MKATCRERICKCMKTMRKRNRKVKVEKALFMYNINWPKAFEREKKKKKKLSFSLFLLSISSFYYFCIILSAV